VCGKSPPAAFSHHSEAQRTAQSTIRLFARCGLAGRIFAHPAWPFIVVSTLDIRDGYKGQNEFFRSLLG
jgi:hypothetical protein